MVDKTPKFKPDEVIAVLGMVLMLTITCASILSRYVLPVAWSFTEELVCATFILVSLIGAAMATRDGKAMGISILTDLLPAKCQKWVVMIQSTATLIFSLALLWYGIGMVRSNIKSGMRTAALDWPEAIFSSFIPLGAFCLAIASVQFAYGTWKKNKEAR